MLKFLINIQYLIQSNLTLKYQGLWGVFLWQTARIGMQLWVQPLILPKQKIKASQLSGLYAGVDSKILENKHT